MTVGLRVDEFFSDHVGTGGRSLYDDQYYLYCSDQILGSYSKFVTPVNVREEEMVLHPVNRNRADFKSVILNQGGELTILSDNFSDPSTVYCPRLISPVVHHGFMIFKLNDYQRYAEVFLHFGSLETKLTVRDSETVVIVGKNKDWEVDIGETDMGWGVERSNFRSINQREFTDSWIQALHHHQDLRFVSIKLENYESITDIKSWSMR